MPEREPRYDGSALPPELVAALKDQTYACLTIATDQGTAFIIKAPAHEIQSVRGPIPIELVHELYDHPAAPVIRLALRLYDDPLAPLAMESFINIAEPDQRADYAAFAHQPEIALLFYDETLDCRLTKRITHSAAPIVPEVLAVADELLGRIPAGQFSFELAKQTVQEATRL